MYRGYIKLWRKSFDSGMHRNHKLWVVWTWILGNVTHKKINYMAGSKIIELQPGQIIFGRKRLASELAMSEPSVRTCLSFLQNHKNVTIKTTNKYSLLTVVNWEIYQSESHKVSSEATKTRPRPDHQPTTKQTQKNKRINKKYDYPDAFEAFWFAYPKKVGKMAAYNAWKKHKRHFTTDKILRSVHTHKKSKDWKKDGGQYVPNPSTYINQHRWEDDLTSEQSTPPPSQYPEYKPDIPDETYTIKPGEVEKLAEKIGAKL